MNTITQELIVLLRQEAGIDEKEHGFASGLLRQAADTISALTDYVTRLEDAAGAGLQEEARQRAEAERIREHKAKKGVSRDG